jgi:hypothetical protein
VTSSPGQYPTTCKGAADPDYTIGYSPGILTVQEPVVSVSLNVSTPYGTAPDLSDLLPSDPRITYDPASQAPNVSGTLTCATTATSSSPSARYPISSCSGLSDPGYTVVYDYTHSGYTITLAPVVLTFTGPPTLTVGASTIESLKMTTATGAPISGRKVTITLGIKPRIIQHCTATTNANGVAACNIGKAPSYQRYRYITMSFAGDRHGPR